MQIMGVIGKCMFLLKVKAKGLPFYCPFPVINTIVMSHLKLRGNPMSVR